MVRVFNNLEELNKSAAQLFVRAAADAIAKKGYFTVALTGGSSPVGLYRLLASPLYKEQVLWEQVYVFWGDERWVPLTDERSNARMAFETLLNHVPVKEDRVHPMWADGVSAAGYAVVYEQLLQRHLGTEGEFDLVLLGMGADGHTASWFPGTAVLHERTKWVDAYYLAPQEMQRITLTVPTVNRAKQIAVIAYGPDKADALFQVLEGKENIEKYPAQLIDKKEHDITWLVDDAAARLLS